MSNFTKILAERENETKRNAGEYGVSFMASHLVAKEAIAGGYQSDMERFVGLTAHSMQQIIDAKVNPQGGKVSFGWSSLAVPEEYLYVYKDLLLKSIKVLRDTGCINVMLAMPDMAPRYWYAQALKVAARERKALPAPKPELSEEVATSVPGEDFSEEILGF